MLPRVRPRRHATECRPGAPRAPDGIPARMPAREHRMKNMVIAAVLAFGAGVWMALLWISQPLEQRLVEVQLAALMPQQAMALHVEPLDVQVAMLDFAQGGETLATKAHLALSRHGDTAREVLATYSDDPLFRAMLLEYGEAVVPPVYFFMRNELPSLAL